MRDRISLALGAGGGLASILILGGSLRWGAAVAAGFAALALIPQLFARRRADALSPLVILLLVVIALTLVQLLPMPASLVAALEPVADGLRRDGATIAGTDPASTLSLDPAGTLRALTFFITLLGYAVLTLRICGASSRGRYLLLAGVALGCGVAAIVTGAHLLLNADSLYGVYTPHHAHPPILGPLLNANHLGSLAALGGTVAFGLVFYEQQDPPLKVMWLGTGLANALVVFGSESRGAALALAIGIAVVIAVVVASRVGARKATLQQRKTALMRDLPAAIVLIVGLAVAIYGGAGNVAAQLDNTTIGELSKPASKFEAWKSSLQLVADSPWTEVGRGAVETTLTRVHSASSYATFSHLENEYVTTVVEWGIPGAVVIALVFGLCVRTALGRFRDGPLAASALGAIAAVAFQSTVDFGIEMLGVAVPATIVFATLVASPVRKRVTSWPVRAWRVSVIIALVAAAAILPTDLTRSPQEDHDDFEDAPPARVEDLMPMIERHPLDYYGFAQAAELLTTQSDARAVEYLNQALRLHPSLPGLHRLAARLLAHEYQSQAILEYQLALHGSATPHDILAEIVVVLPDAETAARAIPQDWTPVPEILRDLHALKRDDVALRWLSRVVDQPQTDTNLIDLLYSVAMDKHDLAAAKHAAERRLATANTYTSRLMLAKVEAARGETGPILHILSDVRTWRGRQDEQGEAWRLLCHALADEKKLDEALACVRDLYGSGLSTLQQRPDLDALVRSVEAAREAQIQLYELSHPHG